MDNKEYPITETNEQLLANIKRIREAQAKFAEYSQEQVDAIFKAAAIAANMKRIPLAKMAVEETGMGVVEEELYDKMLLAVVDGKVIGSMGYMDIGDNTAEIKRVYTYPEFRGNGISQKMLDLILEDAKDRGFAKVVIETWSKFNRGINFYVKNNFSLKEQEGDCYRYERSL